MEQNENPKKEFNIDITYTISRPATVFTTNYIVNEWDEWETDDTGNPIHIGGEDYDFSKTSFVDEYENDYLTPVQLMEELAMRVSEELSLIGDFNTATKRNLERILKSCEQWSIEDVKADKE